MAIARVLPWSGIQNNSAGTTTTNAPIDTTGANFIAVTFSTDGTVSSVTDNASPPNTYQLAIGPVANGGDKVYIFFAENVVTSPTHAISVTTGSASNFSVLCAGSYSGLATSSTKDKTTSGTGNSTSLSSGNTATTSQADELLIGAGTLGTGSNSTFTGTGGFAVQSQNGLAGSGSIGFLADQIVSSAAAYAATATWGGSSGPWVAAIVTFKAPAAAGGSFISKAIWWDHV